MNIELSIERFFCLPQHVQLQVADYIDFLTKKYGLSNKSETASLSAETKQTLDKCWNSYQQNPSKVKTWSQFENEIKQEFDYEL